MFRSNSVNPNPVQWNNEVSNLISTITHRGDKFPEDFEFGAATAAFQVKNILFSFYTGVIVGKQSYGA